MTSQAMVKLADELKPCPFCGGKAAIVLGMKQTVRTVDVICQDCGGAMPAFCEEDAIGDWNTRLATAPAASGGAPEGATHMRRPRRPEYITAWLFDGVSTMPLCLIEKYRSQPLPEHRKGQYALAVDGEFWRWSDAAKFNEIFCLALTAPPLPADGVRERLAEMLANHDGNTLEVEGRGIGIGIADHDKEKYRQYADRILKLLTAPHEQGEG